MNRKPRRILSIIFQCTIVVLIIAALLYFTPWPTRVDLTLNAVKLDANGNEIGTEQIRIKGYKLDYLFQESRLDVVIDPFDDLKYVKFTTDASSGKEGVIRRFDKKYFDVEYLRISFWGWDAAVEDMVDWNLYFTEDLDIFAFTSFKGGNGEIAYVASVGGNYTTREIVEYFNGLVPGL